MLAELLVNEALQNSVIKVILDVIHLLPASDLRCHKVDSLLKVRHRFDTLVGGPNGGRCRSLIIIVYSVHKAVESGRIDSPRRVLAHALHYRVGRLD